ncbi:putative disease resistance protein At4g27220 [Silene latifolia]|uniref:putative disease resistance protein At4g27220 n=1 Tax=Silene latifolia TaxID=37657 RepID=UPI003D76E671
MAIISGFIAKSFNLDDKITILQNKAQLLAARAADITSELDMADLQFGKKRRRQVELWLRNVRQKGSEIETISDKVKNMRLLLPSLQLKDDIARLSKETEELIDQGQFRNGLTLDLNNTRLPLVTRNLVGQMFVQNTKTICRWLGDDKVQRIGIYGMGGVGKSSLMMHVHNMLLDKSIWGDVYWVTASQGSVIELQNKIARSVGLYLSSDEDPRKRAAMLSSILSRIGKIVLILDDLWNHCPLEDLGVPISSTNCKIVVTSRSLDVCRRMACQRFLKVEPLPEGEAWRLFVDRLGNYNTLLGECKEIARSVARECGGLPLGIRTMARAMSGVIDVNEWNNALQELRKPLRGQDDMENEVFPVLRFSFCHLNDTRLQKCFLSCVLYPEGYRILREELIDLWISEGSLEETESREEQFQKGNTILNRLENSCLLEAKNYNGERYVKMHDLLRDMAISITKCSPRFMVYPRAELNEVPNEDQWPENVEKASFVHNHISEILPGVSPKCPKLTTLLLQCNPLENILDSFFIHMKNLKVLNLSFTRIKRVPESISNLENLSAILVNGCWNLTYVPSLTRLQKLRELDFRHTRIKDAPDGLDRLTNLRRLDLSQIKDLSIPFSRILPGLYNLQVFKLSQTLKGIHLMRLSHLERIHCRSIFDMNDWAKFIESRHHWKLKNYNFILLGTADYSVPSRDQGRLSGLDRIVSVYKSSLNGGKKGILLPRNIQFLGINDCQFRERGLLDAIPTLQRATELRVCEIRNCEGIDYLWSPTASHPTPIPPQTFSHFRKLHIYSCPRIKKLFPVALLEQQLLPNLQEIELVNCPNMTEIISANEGDEANVGCKTGLLSLAKLNTLTLCNLPELESICRGLLLCSSLNNISKESCPMLKMIPLSLPLLCDSSDGTLHYLPTDIEWWTSLDKSYPKDVKLLRNALIKRACITSVL